MGPVTFTLKKQHDFPRCLLDSNPLPHTASSQGLVLIRDQDDSSLQQKLRKEGNCPEPHRYWLPSPFWAHFLPLGGPPTPTLTVSIRVDGLHEEGVSRVQALLQAGFGVLRSSGVQACWDRLMSGALSSQLPQPSWTYHTPLRALPSQFLQSSTKDPRVRGQLRTTVPRKPHVVVYNSQ